MPITAPFTAPFTLGPFLVDPEGRLSPGPERTPGFTVRWRERVMHARLEAPAGLRLQMALGRVPSSASARAESLRPQSFALLLHDPEPHPRGSIYDITHWFIYNIPASTTELAEGVPNGDLPDGTKQLKGARGFAGYFGPCAPPGPNHHYTYQLFALDTKLDLGPDATRADAEKAMDGHILGSAEVIQLFHKAQ